MPPPVRRTIRRSSNRGVSSREESAWHSQGDDGALPSPYVSRPTFEDASIDPLLLNVALPAPPPTPSVYPQAQMGTSYNSTLGGGQLGPADWDHLPMTRCPPTWGTLPSIIASPTFDRPFPHLDLVHCGAYPEPPPQMQWSSQLYHHGAFTGSSETLSTLSSLTRLSESPVPGASVGSRLHSTGLAAPRSARRTTGSSSPSSSSS